VVFPKPNPAGEYNWSAVLPKPLHWRHFQQLQKAYKNLLMARQPTILQSKVGTSGFWYRVRVVTDTRTEAEKLCSGLRAAGSGCLVQRN
jgi:hypothetical protein